MAPDIASVISDVNAEPAPIPRRAKARKICGKNAVCAPVSARRERPAVAVVKPGRILFELSFPNEEQARIALNKAIQKLPLKARVVTREERF